MINNITLTNTEVAVNKNEKESTLNSFNSVFDVHNNGIIDFKDFTSKDLENNFIKEFLNKHLNKEWTIELENFIKPYLSSKNTDNFETNLHGYKVKYENNSLIFSKKSKSYAIQVLKDSTVSKTDIKNLYDIITNLSPEVLKDFLAEINAIKLSDEISFGGRGFFDFDNIIELSTKDDNYGVNKYTLIHELGHAISSKKYYNKRGREYSDYSFMNALKKRFNGNTGINMLIAKLQKEFGSVNNSNNQNFGTGYALVSMYEFSAEYYTYKKEGKTNHQSEKLFKALEASSDKDYKDLLKIIDESFKLSKKDEANRKT